MTGWYERFKPPPALTALVPRWPTGHRLMGRVVEIDYTLCDDELAFDEPRPWWETPQEHIYTIGDKPAAEVITAHYEQVDRSGAVRVAPVLVDRLISEFLPEVTP